ncbi:TPA: tRNA (adenosine(37)-N6)-threonylcarbamoyltransferase complex ATPase subunit type 1 TsaE [Candidatus Uhrbacteria bacterium]|uniref:tRNA threonylcarbamoyladenosine biosynthesis protein TsaE n=2 Tax=Candidatus Uhriibacteriota TaxID=1752732 RepID=A0A0G1SHZ4_9BACT|nr:MAG: hypothetical protein UX45_C0010G0025 [Candidatus Uhrbacteria bacterium GW2011_GWF2_46_218]KKU41688.1 MAG: hypothetical protein UX57_C0002G0059 [Candidatus Uhrbacteria bacterium GW2011_GWE2_46_68]HBK33443.1 tRNA (adenosine(37)-N6)-threonylcarbamoyltransferase complex ATPase subunit type 1 TsaE [Candidatus Uhrbacteria bacterium]HCB19520.1 tRNA (adenosine(37)-N6)-threonylcarbamoyltransferase complex ATPase subunit type 1 TsaE [Candidatus Uhrbacteria bacterium]
MTFSTHTPEETKQLAVQLASSLQGGEILALEGDLGSGKTTFVQGLGEALGVKAYVRSPSFTLMNIYHTSHPTIHFLVHLDCYRLGPLCDLQGLELEEWLHRSDVIIVIEWPPHHLLNKNVSISIIFEMINAQTRNISLPLSP